MYSCAATVVWHALGALGVRRKGVGCRIIVKLGVGPSVRLWKSPYILFDGREGFQGVGHVNGIVDRCTAGFQGGLCPLWVIGRHHAVTRPCPLYPRKRTSSDTTGKSALCQNVWPGRAVQDGLPRSTNVRAASMYQASEVKQFAPGHHGYPRASEADYRQDLEGPFWHPVCWLRRADRSSIFSFHLAGLGGKAIYIEVGQSLFS